MTPDEKMDELKRLIYSLPAETNEGEQIRLILALLMDLLDEIVETPS